MFKRPGIWVAIAILFTMLVLLVVQAMLPLVANTDSKIQVSEPTTQAASTRDCVNVGTGWNGLIRTIDWEADVVCYEGDHELRCFLISETNLERADSK